LFEETLPNGHTTYLERNQSLDPYKGNSTVYIAFRHWNSTDWFQLNIDDITISSSLQPVTISVFEGETVNFTDLSTNNPIVWHWSALGSVETDYFSQNPTVKYNVAGTYDVSLTAGNAGGSNTKIKTGYVVVAGRAPIANFVSSANLTTGNYQPFIPAGGAVEYNDASTRIPTSWNWTFNGGNPSSSTSQNPGSVTYTAAGTYTTSLQATNAAGSDTKSAADYVVVGGTAYVTNSLPADGITYYNVGDGLLPGHCNQEGTTNYYFTQYAELFTNSYEGQITSLEVGVGQYLGNGNVTFKVWDGSTGEPGTELATKTFVISTLSVTDYFTTITFDAPVDITGDFFVGYEITYNTGHDFATDQFCGLMADRSTGGCTAWGYIDVEGWATIDSWFDGFPTALFIYPEFTYASSGVTAGDVNEDAALNVLDVVWLVDHLNGSTPSGFNATAADVNGSGGVDIADLTSLIDLIMGGAKDESKGVSSENGEIYLGDDGLITFDSDGTLTALQFELSPGIEETGISLLVDSDHKLAYNAQTGKGVIYSMTNSAFAAGKIDLMQVENVNLDNLEWGNVLAANTDSQTVEVIASKFGVTGIDEVSNAFDMLVYPNPNNGTFAAKIYLPVSMKVELQLIDVLGRIVSVSPRNFHERGEYKYEFESNSKLRNGVYILKVNGYDANGDLLIMSREVKLMIMSK